MNFPRDETEIRAEIAAAIEGLPHELVILALGSLLSQACADISPTVEEARFAVDKLCTAIKADMAQNWHLVEARRKALAMPPEIEVVWDRDTKEVRSKPKGGAG